MNYTEVLYGANAFQYAATSLGGAINFVTHTGQTSPGTYLRVEAGSYGYRKQQISNGGAAGNFDWYVSLLHNSRDGYQDLTDTNGRELVANLGYRFGPRLDTRLLLRYREEELINGGTLTLAQINSGSRANPAPMAARKAAPRWWVAKPPMSSTMTRAWSWGGPQQLSALQQLALFHHAEPVAIDRHQHQRALLAQRRHLVRPQPGHQRDLERYAAGVRRCAHPRPRQLAPAQEVRYTGSRDTVLALGGELQLDASSWLSAGVSLINIDRDVRVVQSTTANTSVYPQRYALDTWYAAPRLGLRYRRRRICRHLPM